MFVFYVDVGDDMSSDVGVKSALNLFVASDRASGGAITLQSKD